MHHYINAYYFIADFNKSEILNLDIKITLIFRNYHQTSTEKEPIVLKKKQLLLLFLLIQSKINMFPFYRLKSLEI
jgi:hypothetical protein